MVILLIKGVITAAGIRPGDLTGYNDDLFDYWCQQRNWSCFGNRTLQDTIEANGKALEDLNDAGVLRGGAKNIADL